MEITLNTEQRDFLTKVKKQHDDQLLNMSAPWMRIGNILKNGVYYDDKDSWYKPPKETQIETDVYMLNQFASEYKKHMKL